LWESIFVSDQQIRRDIIKWAKHNRKLSSVIGDIPLDGLIGEGGTSLVFGSEFAGEAAVKFLLEDVSHGATTRYKRFLSEYVNMIRLVATGAIVPLYHFDVQKIGNAIVPYIVMELCKESLQSRCKNGEFKDVEAFESLIDRLLFLLETIHRAGIVHRDIKPQNILLRQNGEWVLADFGISWFDPQFYERMANTKRSDRLANWQFSPPEQFRRDGYNRATPSLDLYALGQVLYYCVTGTSIRGTNYPRFAEVAPSLSFYDEFIGILVQQRPEKRLQSVKEVRLFLERRRMDSSETWYTRLARQQPKDMFAFDECLARAMPGSIERRYVQARNEEEIDRVLFSLADGCEQYHLWWTKGRQNLHINRIERLHDGIWLINGFECQVIDLWLRRHPTLERQYVIIHLAPRPPFGIYDEAYSSDWEEAGYFRGRYVTRGEFDDGYALLDGKSVDIRGKVKLRSRNLVDDFLLLAPQTSVYLSQSADKKVREVYLSLRQAGKIVRDLLLPLEDIERELWMTIND